jgi:hypothetical protein
MIAHLTAFLIGEKVNPPAGLDGDLPSRVVLRQGRLLPWLGGLLARLGEPAAAVTLGRTIVVNPGVRLSRSLLVHELAHVRQWERDALFPIRYSLATLRHGYHDNPYEVEARQQAAAATPHTPGEDTA